MNLVAAGGRAAESLAFLFHPDGVSNPERIILNYISSSSLIGDSAMGARYLTITCPLCGRKNEHSMEGLVEGAILACPFCKVKLTLHGHMWEDIQKDIAKLKEEK
jgi:hypothetical protein